MQLRDNSQRARNVLIVFYILIPVYVLTLSSNFMEYNMLQEEYTYEEGAANDTRQMIIGFLFFCFYVLAGVSFIMWFRRAYFNLKAMDYNPLFTDGWAAGAWFVPILNLFRPYKIMEEIWDVLQDKVQNIPYESKTILGVWWGFWVIGGVVDRVNTRIALNAETIEDYENVAFVSMFTDIGNIISLILVILIIRKVSSWEEQAYNKNFEMDIEDHLI